MRTSLPTHLVAFSSHFCNLFNDAIINETIWGRMMGPTKSFNGITDYLSEVAERKHETLSENISCPDRESNRTPTEHKAKALPLDQPVSLRN
jgi:hypothetical protein